MPIPNPFGRFFNDPDLEQIEGFINGILTTPVDNKDSNSENISSEFINDFYKTNDTEKKELDQIFSQFSIPAERLQRYGAYDEIYRSVQMIKRIVKVYKPYIIQKNPVTGLWYLLRKTDYTKSQKVEDEQISEDAKQFYNDVIENFDLQNKLKNNITHPQLMYGDSYVEVINLKVEKEKIKDLSKVSILNEVVMNKLKLEVDSFNRNTPQLQINSLIEAVTDQLVKVDAEIDKDELQKDSDLKFQNTILRIHKPHNIIVLETSYGTILGYLEINKDVASQSSSNVAQTLSNITSRLVSTGNGKEGGITDTNAIINKIISHILKKVNVSRGNSDSKTKYGDSVIEDLKRFLIEQNAHNTQMNLKPLEVRFIPVSRMVNFSLPSTESHPYGGSLLESLMLPGKLYILSQLSNVMQKLSRAPVTRKWIIDQGSVQNTGQLLQKLKRELHNNRIAIDDLTSFKSVSKIMSDYKDFFVLSKNGQRALDVEVNSIGDPSVKVQDLEDSRREIIALSGVPAPYLGYMDVVELREQLIHSNISFATEIVDIQDNDNRAMNRLIDIIADVENKEFKPSKFYSFQLIPPVVLILQLVEMTMSSIGNIFGIFQTAGMDFDPYYFLEKYVPYIDWNDFKNKSEEYKRKIDVKTGVEAVENGALSGGLTQQQQ